jgi:hypothetical protein
MFDTVCPSNFSPISLCNVILKFVTKTIANRIKSIIPSIISHYQSAFVPERLISDDVLLAFEAFHFLDHLKKGKQGYVGIKLTWPKPMIQYKGVC